MTDKPKYMTGRENGELIEGLTGVLADTFMLYYKTHSFHWNVVGPHFPTLHSMFEDQYTEMWQAADTIAERIRQLEGSVPINLRALGEHAYMEEAGQTPDDEGMVEMLARDNEEIVSHIHPVLHRADTAGDQNTVDILATRIGAHEKAAWMLRSFLR